MAPVQKDEPVCEFLARMASSVLGTSDSSPTHGVRLHLLDDEAKKANAAFFTLVEQGFAAIHEMEPNDVA